MRKLVITASVTDETPITEEEFNKIKNLSDTKRAIQTFRRKCPVHSRTMSVERWDSKSADKGVIKYTCPEGDSFFYEAELTGVEGLGIVQPEKVMEVEEHKDPKHPIWIDPKIGLQYKYNGMRLTAYIKGPEADWSVRHSNVGGGLASKREVLSYINFPPEVKGSIIDCEAHCEKFWKKVPGSATPLQAVIRILNVNPKDSAKRLREWGKPEIRVFDCLAFKGESVKDKPYKERLVFASVLVDEIKSPYVTLVDTVFDNKYEQYKKFIEEGGEGAVLKDFSKSYGDPGSMYKVKRSTTFDCYIIGFVQGNGKYKEQVGGFKWGTTLSTGKKVYVCNSNVGNDKERTWATANQDKLLGKVYELTFQEWSVKGPQHPRLVDGIEHPRKDKTPEDSITEEGMVPPNVWKNWTEKASEIHKFETLPNFDPSAPRTSTKLGYQSFRKLFVYDNQVII